MIFRQIVRFFIVIALYGHVVAVNAHQQHSTGATYIGNEGVMVFSDHTKVLFDPFFHKNFGIYQLVPNDIRQAIFQGKAPYNDINFVIISHAHDDHFSARDMLNYLLEHHKVKLIAPVQAINKLKALSDFESHKKQILPRLYGVKLAFGDMPWSAAFEQVTISAVRIPHAGWPGRADIENIVFSVVFKNGARVTHMGDADADDDHYLQYRAYWKNLATDTAFPPYWFFYSAEGRDILDEIIAAKQQIGIHVPVEVPKRLISTGKHYFSRPGTTINIETSTP